MSVELAAGRRRVRISSADRVLIPDVGLTKLDLARHYAGVADAMLPHVRERPLTLHSFPAGIEKDGYFVKDVPRHFPKWIATALVPKREGGAIRQVVARNAATLVYLAGQNSIALHVWPSRADRLERPDRLVFDLDPSTHRFAEVRAAARALGDLLRDIGLTPFAMTTGSRGLHVVAPVRRTTDFDTVRPFVRELAKLLAKQDPARLTVEFRRKRRGERIYVDVGRNVYGQHSIAPYSVRALPGAPVATPLHWEELSDRRLDPQGWTVTTIGDRLAELGDPWSSIGRHAGGIGRARRALERAYA